MTTANVPEFKLEEVPAELAFTIEHICQASAADLYQAFVTEENSSDGLVPKAGVFLQNQ